MKNKITDDTWDFRKQNTKYSTHGLHAYPAMMIPQIAERLIRENIGNGKTILDPFCGSGTVLVESMKIGKKSYGVDINPLAILISKAKTTPIEPQRLLKASRKLLMECRFGENKTVNRPDFQNIDFWFQKNIIKQLSIIRRNIDRYKSEKDLYNFFLVSFSESVRRSSNTRSGEFKLYRRAEGDLKNYKPDAMEIFENRLMKSVKPMENFYKECKNSKKPTIIKADLREGLPIKDKIDLVVSSPPYGDSRTTVAYGQFSRLSLQWLGMDDEKIVKSIDNISLGGIRYKNIENIGSPTLEKILKEISKSNPARAVDVFSFNKDLLECLRKVVEHMSDGAKLCLVVGNRTVAGMRIPTDDILVELGNIVGLSHIKTMIRNIPSKRMPSENSPSNIRGEKGQTMTKEHIVILEKL